MWHLLVSHVVPYLSLFSIFLKLLQGSKSDVFSNFYTRDRPKIQDQNLFYLAQNTRLEINSTLSKVSIVIFSNFELGAKSLFRIPNKSN